LSLKVRAVDSVIDLPLYGNFVSPRLHAEIHYPAGTSCAYNRALTAIDPEASHVAVLLGRGRRGTWVRIRAARWSFDHLLAGDPLLEGNLPSAAAEGGRQILPPRLE